MKDFIKNPQTRNARAFLPLNISAVGSVVRNYSHYFLKSTLDNKALLSNPSQAPLASLQEKRSVFSDTKCEHKTCPEGDGIWNEDVTVIDLVENFPRIGNLLTTFGEVSLISKVVFTFSLILKNGQKIRQIFHLFFWRK